MNPQCLEGLFVTVVLLWTVKTEKSHQGTHMAWRPYPCCHGCLSRAELNHHTESSQPRTGCLPAALCRMEPPGYHSCWILPMESASLKLRASWMRGEVRAAWTPVKSVPAPPGHLLHPLGCSIEAAVTVLCSGPILAGWRLQPGFFWS